MLDLAKTASFEDIVGYLARQTEDDTKAISAVKLPIEHMKYSMAPSHDIDAFHFYDLQDTVMSHPFEFDTTSFQPVFRTVEVATVDKTWFMDWLAHNMEQPISHLSFTEMDRAQEFSPVASRAIPHDPFNGFDKVLESFDHFDNGVPQPHLESYSPIEKAMIVADDTSFFL